MADEYDADFVEQLLDEALKSMRVRKKGFTKEIASLITELADLAQVRELVLMPSSPQKSSLPPIVGKEGGSEAEEGDVDESAGEKMKTSPMGAAGGAANTVRLLREETANLTVGSVTSDGREVISARTCVVCGLDSNPGENRKSGFKCHTCVGLPSRKKFAVKVEESDHLDKNYDEDGLKVINNYIFLNKLGNGAYGKVKLAQHNISNQQYAVKIVKKSAIMKAHRGESGMAMMQQEIEIMKALKHPCITSVVSVVDDPSEDKLYIFMELLLGGQIYDIGNDGISPKPPIEMERLKKYIVGIASGLQYLHSKGIVHRDIKPENILLDAHDNVKLADFGVSSQCDDDVSVMSNSAGSPAYWCPEEYLQVPVQGRAQDIWAFGVTVFAMAVGRLPFYSPDRSTMQRLILASEPDYPADMDPLLVDLISKMLAKDQTKRIKVSEIFEHPLLFDVRTVKGFAVETVKATIKVLDPEDVTEIVNPTNPPSSSLFSEVLPDGYIFRSTKERPGKGFAGITQFFDEHGPTFQVVRSGLYSITLYSIRSDPRRKSVVARTKSMDAAKKLKSSTSALEASECGVVQPTIEAETDPTDPESPNTLPSGDNIDNAPKSPMVETRLAASLEHSLSGGVTPGPLTAGLSTAECNDPNADAFDQPSLDQHGDTAVSPPPEEGHQEAIVEAEEA